MGMDNIIFLENIEWFDESGEELVHRIPESGSGEIKWGANLTVRESQVAVLFYKGKACDAFGPGRHTLKTGNIPILTKILSIPWAMQSPLRAEVYFVNLKTFFNLKWGTRDPVAFKDAELGLVRLRAHGMFNIHVTQPVLFINSMVGTAGQFTTESIEEYLKRVIVSRFNDHLGEHINSLFDLPGNYEELSTGLRDRLQKDFGHFGIGLLDLFITSITPPPESAAGYRRPQPHQRPAGSRQTVQDEGCHGHGESRRQSRRGRWRHGHGLGIHAAGYVRANHGCPAEQRRSSPAKGSGSNLPRLPEQDTRRRQVLSFLRSPAIGLRSVQQLRQEPAAQRQVLFTLRPPRG